MIVLKTTIRRMWLKQKCAWGGASVARKKCPVGIYEGALVHGDNYSYDFEPIYAVLRQCWGYPVKSIGITDDPIKLRDQVNMIRYLVQEKIFHTGLQKLDKNLITKFV